MSSAFVLKRAIIAAGWIRTVALALAFAALWCVWGKLCFQLIDYDVQGFILPISPKIESVIAELMNDVTFCFSAQ